MSTEPLINFFKALADESRLRIVGLLAQREASGEELAAMLKLNPATISHHMNRLKTAGLIDARAEGYYTLYRLKTDGLHMLAKQLFSTETVMAAAGDVDISAYDKKVLRDFMTTGGKLKTIPAQRKKKTVVLRHITEQFKSGRRYSERQVNDILKRFHPDTATLRREMIVENLLSRERGQYWRTNSGS